MIYLRLFLNFLKIGVVSFGGGYGMISIINDTAISNGWLTQEEFLNIVAVSESTPGPIAVNMATFVGSSEAGFFGSLLATLGVIFPAFLIMLLISAVIKNFLKYNGVKAVLGGVAPAVVGLILSTSITMFLNQIFSISTIKSVFDFDFKALVIFVVLSAILIVYKKLRKKSFSPILLILVSGIFGLIFYGIF